MEKFEALFSGKKGKKDDEKPDSSKKETESVSDLEKATELKKEISEITQGRSLEDLELSDLQQVLDKYKQMENALDISSEKKLEGSVQEQMDMAREVMGKEFFGFQEVKEAFGIEIKPEDIPEIPFGRVDLERARELNQFLVLRADKAPDGKPLSLQKINEILKGKVFDGSKLLYANDGEGGIKSDSWYRNEEFSKNETPRMAWALVSKEVISNSTSKNYLQQTEELVNYIKNSVFKGKEIPEEYQEAIKEFEKEKDGIGKIISSDWQKAAEKLSNLKINRLARQNPAEVLYDIAIYFQNKGERILENKYSWTYSRGSDGELVLVGRFDSDGAFVDRWRPGSSDGGIGVAFSRSL
jgi:hypothetical protein